MNDINISVRTIVEFILRSGNIDTGYMSQNRMRDGILAHQRVQRARKREAEGQNQLYEAEMRLSLRFEHDELSWKVSGIADGVILDGDWALVEEIKSTGRDLDTISLDESHWHMAQAKCYGHMLFELHGLEMVTINLTYCDVEGGETRVFSTDFTPGELRAFFFDLIERYSRWAKLKNSKNLAMIESVKATPFPYAGYRKGQRKFAGLAYYAIRDGHKLFIEAPTGTGKTISALFPAVKALGEKLCNKVFYLTAKTITRQAAEQAAGFLARAGAKLTYVAMTAKDKLCVLDKRACTPLFCPRADGHFDRVNDALWDMLNKTDHMGREAILETAEVHMVCPYEMMLDATLFADLIICDYNYVFDPSASLKRFFNNQNTEKYAFLIDEAHNLAERAREMYSSTLIKSDFDKLARVMKKTKEKRVIKDISKEISAIASKIPEGRQALAGAAPPKDLRNLLDDLVGHMDKWLGTNARTAEAEAADIILEVFFRVLDFIRVYDNMDERYTPYVERFGKDIELTLLCLDPSEDLANALAKAAGAVFFSATLTPLGYFKNVLGGGSMDKIARFPSPFDHSRLRVIVENRISTKYKDRNQDSYARAAQGLYAMIKAQRGNYFAFFSSYAYLENVLEAFTEKYPGQNTLVQGKDMSEAQREDFLAEFKEGNEVLAFAVMGGVFSEGIDLVGERLIGAAIVGVGLPLITPKRDALRDYYDEVLGGGFEYAYMYPGMNKVMQAAGRVIRTETDRGVILLMDSRFTDSRYTELFPLEWRDYKKPGGSGLEGVFEGFWEDGKIIRTNTLKSLDHDSPSHNNPE